MFDKLRYIKDIRVELLNIENNAKQIKVLTESQWATIRASHRLLGEYLDALSQPSLPSNLDEAAEEYAYNNWEDNDYHTGASEGLPFDAIGHTEKCFKAGAEWMAGQGVSMQITDDTEWADVDSFIHKNVSGGSIIQIRKK